MGIHGLVKYIQKYTSENKSHHANNEYTTIVENTNHNKEIYISGIVYYDFTSKMIEFYNKYCKQISNVDDMILYIIHEMGVIFERLLNFNDKIFVFLDYKQIGNISSDSILFRDFLSSLNDFNDEERYKSTPFIKKKYVDEIVSLSDTHLHSIGILRSKIICGFELKRTKNRDSYIALSETTLEDSIKDLLTVHSWYRYLILRGAKRLTSIHRTQQLRENGYLDNKVVFTDVFNKTSDIIKLLFEKRPEFNHRVQFFGCCTESDFSIAKHVNTYNKFSYITLYSNDTDMLATLCDINCSIKLNVKSFQGFKSPVATPTGQYKSSDYIINPKEFWHYIFDCELSPKIIKILCVLMGTDYNPYSKDSVIHIHSFDDILELMNITSFEELDEDDLLIKIYCIMSEHKDDIHVKQTAMAFNMYLSEIECNIFPL